MTIAFVVGILAFSFIAGFALGSLVVFYRVKLPPLFETEPEPSPAEHPGLASVLEIYWVPTSRAGVLTIKGAK